MGKSKEELAEIDAALGELAGSDVVASTGAKAAANVGALDEVDGQLAELGDAADVDLDSAEPKAASRSNDWDELPTDVEHDDSASPPGDDSAAGDDDFELLVDEDVLELIEED